MTPTEIEATWPLQVIEAIHWIKTHCRHWAILGSHDWQTFDELTEKETEQATEHLLVLLIMGLVGVASTVPKKKPGRCGIPNFYIKPLVSYQEHTQSPQEYPNGKPTPQNFWLP